MRNNLRRILIVTVTLIVCLSLTFSIIGSAITNGQPDEEKHPYVCMIIVDCGDNNYFYGSGTQISSTVIVTAGHLTDGALAASVFFEANANPNFLSGWPFGGSLGTAYTHPEYEVGGSPTLPDWITQDVGVIVLDEEHPLSEYGELPTQGLVDTLPMKQEVVQVGYGVQEMTLSPEIPPGPPDWYNQFIRMNATAELIKSKHNWRDEFIKITANPSKGKGGTAFGDSGGPIFLGDTRIILAVTSWGTNYPCAGVSYSSRIDTIDALDFINTFI